MPCHRRPCRRASRLPPRRTGRRCTCRRHSRRAGRCSPSACAATKRLLLGESKSAEYQAAETTPTASSPRLRSNASSMRGPAAEQRDLALEAEIGIAAHELDRVGSGKAVEDAIDVGDLGDIGRVVRRHQRRPQFLDDLAAVILEHALEAGHLLVAEREVLGDRRRALVFEFLRRIVADARGSTAPRSPTGG